MKTYESHNLLRDEPRIQEHHSVVQGEKQIFHSTRLGGTEEDTVTPTLPLCH